MAIMTAVILQLFLLVAYSSGVLSNGIYIQENPVIYGCIGDNITLNFKAEWDHMFDSLIIEKGKSVGYLRNITACDFHNDQNHSDYSVNVTCHDEYLKGVLFTETKNMLENSTAIRFTLTESTETYHKNISFHVSDRKNLQTRTQKNETNDGRNEWLQNSNGSMEIMHMKTECLERQYDNKLASNAIQKSDSTEPITSEIIHSKSGDLLSTQAATGATLTRNDGSLHKVNANLVIILTTSGVAFAIVIVGIMAFIKVKMKDNVSEKKVSKECSKEDTSERWDLVDGGYKDNVLYIPFELDIHAQKFHILNQGSEGKEQHNQKEVLQNRDANKSSADSFDKETETEKFDTGKPEVLYTEVNKRKTDVLHSLDINKNVAAFFNEETETEKFDAGKHEVLYSQVNKKKSDHFYKVHILTDEEMDDAHIAKGNENTGHGAASGKATYENEPLYSQVTQQKFSDEDEFQNQNLDSNYENIPKYLYSTINKGRNGIKPESLLEEDDYVNCDRYRTKNKPIPKPRKKKNLK